MTASVGRARARIGLLGNPGDLYGGKVLAATIDAFETVATVTDTVFYAPASFQPDVADLQRLAVARVAPSKGAIALGLTTDVPVQSGLSGSSAILLATLRALDAHLDLGLQSARDGTDRLGHRTRGSRHRRRPPGSRHPGPRRPPVHGLLRPRRDRHPRVSRSRSPPAVAGRVAQGTRHALRRRPSSALGALERRRLGRAAVDRRICRDRRHRPSGTARRRHNDVLRCGRCQLRSAALDLHARRRSSGPRHGRTSSRRCGEILWFRRCNRGGSEAGNRPRRRCRLARIRGVSLPPSSRLARPRRNASRASSP